MNKIVRDEIVLAEEFRNKIEKLMLEKGQCPIDERNTLLVAYWSLSFEFHRGILRLIDQGLFGAAFALLRPIIESVVRAHVVLICSADDLTRLANDEYRINFQTIGAEIDRNFGMGDFFENFLKNTRLALHSYTHAGLLQLGRRFTGNNVIPNYSEEEIIESIHIATNAVFMANNLTTKHFGFEAAWNSNTEQFAVWSDASINLPLIS